jgi:uncharacterized protein
MIHQYKLNGYSIVLDTYSGAVHQVDGIVYDMIALWQSTPHEEIIRLMLDKYGERPDVDQAELEQAFWDIEQLIAKRKLFSADAYAGLAASFKNKNTSLKALCLHVAHTCNLNCEYCFAAQGKYQGERALMSFEVGKQALDFLVANSAHRTNLEVDFFGGEPLMNWPVVKQLVAYARTLEQEHGKRFRFTLTTNGLLIDDEVINFANREMHNVVLSLDGRREIHDHWRKTIDGRGSYDLVLPKFQRLVEKRGNRSYYIRGTFTHANSDFFQDILHMLDLGFKELSLEPVVCAPGAPYALTEDDLPRLFTQYELLAQEQLQRSRAGEPFNFYHYMIDLDHGPCLYKRVSGCGSGVEYLAVTPRGELYPCHQFVGDPAFCLGDVWQGITRPQLREEFRHCHVYARPECAECWAKLYCSGGCAANAYHAAGSIRGVYDYGCQLFRKRIECAIMVKVAEDADSMPQ